jgi:hypothetical protein
LWTKGTKFKHPQNKITTFEPVCGRLKEQTVQYEEQVILTHGTKNISYMETKTNYSFVKSYKPEQIIRETNHECKREQKS